GLEFFNRPAFGRYTLRGRHDCCTSTSLSGILRNYTGTFSQVIPDRYMKESLIDKEPSLEAKHKNLQFPELVTGYER
ncbi:MAG: hypothetical protein AAF528_00180, partial [Cyanobacteria bacterium P01_C01_bin.121]